MAGLVRGVAGVVSSVSFAGGLISDGQLGALNHYWVLVGA